MSTTNVFDLFTGLVSYWPLGNVSGSTVSDVVGNNDATAISITESEIVPGYNQYQNALDFDSVNNDKISLPNVSALNFGNNDAFTVSAWIKILASETDAQLLQCGSTGTRGYRCDIRNGKLRFTFSRSGGTESLTLVGVDLSEMWHHVIWAWGDTTAKYYTDGRFIASEVPSNVWLAPATEDFIVVNVNYGGPCADVMIWDRELTRLEQELLYKRQLRGLKI